MRISDWSRRVLFRSLKDTPAARLLAARREALHLAWLSLPPAEGFAEMSALSSETKQALFAWCIAQTLLPHLAFEDKPTPVVDQLGERLGIALAPPCPPAAHHSRPRVSPDYPRVRQACLPTSPPPPPP